MLTQSSPADVCPHVVFREVLGQATVANLLTYVAARQADFKPALVRNRESGEIHVDYGLRSSLKLADLGPFRTPLETYVHGVSLSALAQLNLAEASAEIGDFTITAFRDGNRFGAHIDTDERLTRVRILTCVYYFALSPRRFSGGQLRLYGFPTVAAGGTPAFVDIVPETDTMVVFPSWLRHEVLPMRVPSGAWMDSRFSLNCWLHRAGPAGTAAGGA
jgi:hypothetical protein